EIDYREALRIALAIDFREGVANYTTNLADLAIRRRDWPSAEVLVREALLLSETIGRLELISIDCYYLAIALVRQGKKAEALPYARRAMNIFTQLGFHHFGDVPGILAECEA